MKKTRKVMVFGSFDILHKGHLNFFNQAKRLGNYLIVVVARDKTIIRLKKRSPIHTERLRIKNLKRIDMLNKVLLGNVKNKYSQIMKEKPDIIALGYDQTYFVKGLKEELLRLNFRLKVVRLKPYRPNIYKSSIIKKDNK